MGELIYNQTHIPEEKWRYGFRPSAKTGCGWIALYNALTLMGENPDAETLIQSLERQIPLINGNAGTILFSPGLLLKQWGYPVRSTAVQSRFDSLCRESDAAILFYYWRSGLRIGSHFVAVRCTEQGFWGYNTFSNSEGPDFYGNSLEKFLRQQKFFGCVLTALRKKPEGKR